MPRKLTHMCTPTMNLRKLKFVHSHKWLERVTMHQSHAFVDKKLNGSYETLFTLVGGEWGRGIDPPGVI